MARRDLAAIVRLLKPFVDRGLPILFLEPSCASVFRDELPDLDLIASDGHPDLATAARELSEAVTTVEEFLASMPDERWGRLLPEAVARSSLPTMVPTATEHSVPDPAALVHVHCHQRALVGVQPTLHLFARLPGLNASEADAGCCGMAGAFGYEREHHDVSVAMAERKLAPAVRAAGPETIVVADGASCREQIRHVTGRRAMHPVEVVAAWRDRRGQTRRSAPTVGADKSA